MMRWINFPMLFLMMILSNAVLADSVVIPMHSTQGKNEGKAVGTITATDTKFGLLLTPHLHGLPPGAHGFHVHAKPSCNQNGKAAEGHYDPDNTQHHLGPYNTFGHKGDLPLLCVNHDGTDVTSVMAPRLTVEDLKGRSLIIHGGGDNFSDKPKALGGGGPRIACGIVPKSYASTRPLEQLP